MGRQMMALQRNASETSAIHHRAATVSSFAPDWMQDKRPSLLIIGRNAVQPRLRAMAEAAGARCIGCMTEKEAIVRLPRIVDVDVVAIDCAHPDGALPGLLPSVVALVRDNRAALVIATNAHTLDAAFADLGFCTPIEAAVQWMFDPVETDWESALGQAVHRTGVSPSLQDSGKERDHAQLQKLSEEVEQLARRLDKLRYNGGDAENDDMHDSAQDALPHHRSGKPVATMHSGREWPLQSAGRNMPLRDQDDTLTAATVRALLRSRRLRDEFFGEELFADPAWDMMLDLMAARLSGERVSVSSLCIASAVPPTTALRWIRHLTDRGIVERRPDPHDGRRVFIALSDQSASAIHRWYSTTRSLTREGLD